MKIAIVSPMVLPCPPVKGGAVEMLTWYLAEGAAKENEVDLYTKYDEKLDEIEYKNINIIKIKIGNLKVKLQRYYDKINYKFFKGKLNFYSFIDKKTAKEISKHKYDYIIVENEMVLYKYIYKYTKKTNAKLIYHIHNDFGAANRTKKYYEIIDETASDIIAISKYIKERCIEFGKTDNVHVLYNCIDENLYSNNKENFRKEYKISEKELVIGFSGRLLKEKGILELVQAFKKIKTNKKLRLLIVGTNNFANLKKDKYLMQVYKEIENIKEKVTFTGYVDIEDMPKIYNTMDILVVPSMWEEPLGCVAIEGMARGVPIVATRSGGLPEMISENNGFLVEKERNVVDNILEKLQLLVDNEKLLQKIRKKTEEDFWKHTEYYKSNYYENFKKCIDKR